METQEKKQVTVETIVKAPIDKVWEYFTVPEHITRWYFASDDWAAPYADNDLLVDGKFKFRLAAKDHSAGFDFEGRYTKIEKYKLLEYIIGDGRKVMVTFSEEPDGVRVKETFDAENENSIELQRNGWQAILDNFKKYVEGHEKQQ